MGKRMFEKNEKRQLYAVNSQNIDKPEIFQDTSKENFLFCPQCEKYFGVLDTYFSEHLHKPLLKARTPENFDLERSITGSLSLTAKKVDAKMIFLFVDSILFRCHCASVFPYKDFLAPTDVIEKIRKQLLFHNDIKGNQVLQRCQANTNFEFRPFYVSTPIDWSERYVSPHACAIVKTSPAFIQTSDYLFVIHFTANPIERDMNKDNDKITVLLLTPEMWNIFPNAIIRRIVKQKKP